VAVGGGGAQRDPQYSSLSVAGAHQVQLLADSAGFGFCRGITKQGQRCRRAVDKTVSEYCEWHALQQQRQIKSDMRGAVALGAGAAAGPRCSGIGDAGALARGGGSIAWPGGGSPCGGGSAPQPPPPRSWQPSALANGAALTAHEQKRKEAPLLGATRVGWRGGGG
jgi:hypothetical protein